MDNMWLGRYPQRYVVDGDKILPEDTKAIFDELDIDMCDRARA